MTHEKRRITHRWPCPAAAVLTTLAMASSLSAQVEGNGGDPAAVRSLSAVRVSSGPDPSNWRASSLWQQAEPATSFVQLEPLEGQPATERTEVRLLFDSEAIYVGAWMYDSDVDQIIPGERRRDAGLDASDAFRVIFDTYHDGQNGFVFGTSPSGIEHDGQVVGEGRSGGGRVGGGGGGDARQQGGAQGGFSINWDGSWTVQTEVDEEGWYAFFRIPFSTLRYASETRQEWGVNFSRKIARKNEDEVWSPVPRQYNLYRVSNAGLLSAIEVPSQRVFTVTPYALASAQRIPALHEGVRYPKEFGADMKLGVTQGLTLDLTANTDFAQVEVDEQQLDLTRFSLLYPEKRPFFLENAGRFAVGNNRSAQMFFSRRIGISSTGAPVPIDWGSRLSGRLGGVDVGLLHMQTEGLEGVQPATRWSVARVSQELPNRSKIGAIFTDRSAIDAEDDYGRTYAADASVGIGEFLDLEAVVGGVQRPGISNGREAIIFNGTYRSRDWQITGLYDQIGENFRPEVGYLRRGNFRQFGGSVWRFIRFPGISWLREIRPHSNYDISHTLDTGFKETSDWHLHVPVVWESGAQVSPALDLVYDGLSEPYDIAPGIAVSPGEYQGWTLNVSANTSSQREVSFRTAITAGHFLSGDREGASASVTFRRGSTLAGSLSFSHDQIDLAEGSFDVTLTSARIAYSFSPSVFIQSLVQYGSQTKIWSGNVRLGWINTAGTGLYLVYNERQMVDDIAGPLERSFLIKFNHQLDLSGIGRN